MTRHQQSEPLPDHVRATPERVQAAITEYLQHHKPTVPVGCAPDAIKLFVGNLPRCYLEPSLRPIFAQFGSVVEITVVRAPPPPCAQHSLARPGAVLVPDVTARALDTR